MRFLRVAAWVVFGLGLLVLVASVHARATGAALPGIVVNGRPVVAADTVPALLACGISLLAVFGLGRALSHSRANPEGRLARFERLPCRAPQDNAFFYSLLFMTGPLLGLLALDLPWDRKVFVVLTTPLGFLIGWSLSWAVLGFHFFNPFARRFPKVIVWMALALHGMAVLLILVLSVAMAVHPTAAEAPMAIGSCAGSAVAAAQFLRAWHGKVLGIALE